MTLKNHSTLQSEGSLRRQPYVVQALGAIGIAALIIVPLVFSQFQSARQAAIYSYVASVCKAVESFHQQHGRYPQSLSEIDESNFDHEMGIPLQDLDYQVSDTGFQISYRLSDGHVVECP